MDVSLDVPAGSVCALLGRNGAGKTTTVRILTTLLDPDGGHAQVAGFDIATQADKVRGKIGVTGQTATMDEAPDGTREPRDHRSLCHLGAAVSRQRGDELLQQFDLVDAGTSAREEVFRGHARRLDLAASLIANPEVLFLDEPTTGLDPVSRSEMWAAIRNLVSRGTTVLLTTQYLDEADQLADTIVVVDRGLVVAKERLSSSKPPSDGPPWWSSADADAASLEKVRASKTNRAEQQQKKKRRRKKPIAAAIDHWNAVIYCVRDAPAL